MSSGWQQASDFDPEDPWEKAALDALEAQRKKSDEKEERAASDEGVAVGWNGKTTVRNIVLLDSEREREDESPDWEFYDSSRLVFHADNDVFVRLSSLYRDLLPGMYV